MVVIGLAPHASDGGGYEGDEMWELSARGGEFGEGICSKISEGFGKVVRRSSVLAVSGGFGGVEWR